MAKKSPRAIICTEWLRLCSGDFIEYAGSFPLCADKLKRYLPEGAGYPEEVRLRLYSEKVPGSNPLWLQRRRTKILGVVWRYVWFWSSRPQCRASRGKFFAEVDDFLDRRLGWRNHSGPAVLYHLVVETRG